MEGNGMNTFVEALGAALNWADYMHDLVQLHREEPALLAEFVAQLDPDEKDDTIRGLVGIVSGLLKMVNP